MNQLSNPCCTCKCDECNPIITEPRRCERCDGELGENLNPRGSQYVSSLDVRISGGFGQYIDGRVDTLLCGDCAEELILSWPCLLRGGSFEDDGLPE